MLQYVIDCHLIGSKRNEVLHQHRECKIWATSQPRNRRHCTIRNFYRPVGLGRTVADRQVDGDMPSATRSNRTAIVSSSWLTVIASRKRDAWLASVAHHSTILELRSNTRS